MSAPDEMRLFLNRLRSLPAGRRRGAAGERVVSAPVNSFAMASRPTFMQRAWRRLGWRYHMVDLPETPEIEHMPGWAMTRVRLQFSPLDRLRLLLTGRVRLDIRQKLSADVADIVSATSIEILPPGRAFHD